MEILFIGFAAFLCMPLGKELLYVLDDEFILSNGHMMRYMPIVIVSLCILSAFCALFIFKWWIKKLRYKLNADYIEGSFINSEVVRIARKSRMGLFDKSKNKVLLSSNYSNIEKFDNQHLLISNGNKKGLYSLTYRKIIVPVMYDSISQFVNSVTSATTQGTEHHYDVKGNELR